MNAAVYLSRPGVLSAVGDGLAATVAALLRPQPPQLSRSEAWVRGRNLPVGAVNQALRPFAPTVPPGLSSRNNQLLWHALAAVEPQIEAAKQRYGADRVAVVLGTSTSGVDENIAAFTHVVAGGGWADSGFGQPHQLLSSPAEFVQWQYGLGGLAYVISTACTSGARALISAARLLRAGLADAVVCGGVDCLSLLTVNGFAALEVLSDDTATPFAPQRRGINIGEAAAVFVATREQAHPQDLCLLGYGASSDAWHMSSPRPDGAGAVQTLQAALANTALNPNDIGWINLHGTGTELNDSMESTAVAQCFGTATPCTSTKPYTGHTLGAAGALEAALVWGMASRVDNPSGQLPVQYLPAGYDAALPPLALTASGSLWPLPRRIGLSTSFAFGGNNSALIIGEPAEAVC
jgi:3-oxoacyl-[acyl-carrier-protein] synthase-1